MSILIAYLEHLSGELSPGATQDSLAFATIITDDVTPEDRDALLRPLNSFIEESNQQADLYDQFIFFNYSPTIDMINAFRRATLDVWELKGPPETWQRQLAALYTKKPVFAVLGGISNREWQPIHDFCESQRLPCLFPITDLPAVADNSWYTYYFNKGYYQEGETAARFLNRDEDLPADVRILQVVQDSPAGKALADGFTAAWSQSEKSAATTLILTAKQLREPGALVKVIRQHKPGVLLLWSDDSQLVDLPSTLKSLASPARIFVSSSYLGERTTAIPEAVRSSVFITYPYRLTPFWGTKEGSDAKFPVLTTAANLGSHRITTRIIAMLQQATLQGLRLMYDNLYRDHLFDVMSMQMDKVVLDYERISFGPGQRYVSKGCYIIQLGPGAEPALLPRSEWVVH
jgi:ABC-type branched-subunit amino acid transport system substrate-binding protein